MTAMENGLQPRHWVAACAVAVAVSLAACGDKNQGAAAGGGGGGGGGGGAAAPTVGVLEVRPGSVPVLTELPGRLEANRVAQVRARTAGVVQKRLFREGSEVRQGQSLFQIDNSVQMAALQLAQANLAKAQASLTQASDLARRYKPLAEANAISQQEYTTALANERAARADVAAQQASVRSARINTGYTTVPAPISGRIGKAQVTEGALVGQGDATLLATIQQINPLTVTFNQSASDMLQLRKAIAGGKLEANGNPAVEVVLEDGTVYPHAGRLLFTDATVDATTGQVQLKAEVPNPDGLLLPGLFVKVRVAQSQADDAVLLPQQAVTRSGHGDSVLVVHADGTFAPRKVQVGQAQGNQWLITGGLAAGDQVIVDGVMKLRAGVTNVQTVPWSPNAGNAASGAAPAASAATAAASAASTASAAQ